jgi:hypothetical protein
MVAHGCAWLRLARGATVAPQLRTWQLIRISAGSSEGATAPFIPSVPLDRPYGVLLRFDPVAGDQFGAVFRHQRSTAIAGTFLVDQTAPLAFRLPLVKAHCGPAIGIDEFAAYRRPVVGDRLYKRLMKFLTQR